MHDDIETMLSLKEIILRFIKNNTEEILNGFKLKNLILPFYLAEQILNYLDEENYGIEEEYLKYFKKTNSNLQKVKLNGINIKNAFELSFLKNHLLEKLEIFCIKNFEMNEWIHFIDKLYLKEFSIRGCLLRKINDTCLKEIELLRDFKNLIKLDVSYTNFDDLSLTFICNEFHLLKELDVSGTFIKTFKSLKNLKNLLKFYSINIKKCFHYKETEYLTFLPNLIEIHLDENSFSEFKIERNWLKNLLNKTIWKDLEYFSIMGNWNIDEQTIR